MGSSSNHELSGSTEGEITHDQSATSPGASFLAVGTCPAVPTRGTRRGRRTRGTSSEGNRRRRKGAAATPVAESDEPGLTHWGISYDTGWPDREAWSEVAMRREIGIIRTELLCTDVSIHGSFLDRLTAAGEHGAAKGLHVWLQPRLPDASSTETIDHLVEVARVAERIRANGGESTALSTPSRRVISIPCTKR